MSRRKIGVLVVAVLLIVIGVVGWNTSSKKSKEPDVVCTQKEVYQFDKVSAKDFTYKGKPLDSDSCTIVSPTYNNDSITILVGEDTYRVDVPIVKSNGITWTYRGDYHIPDGTSTENLTPSDFQGIIQYEDDTTKKIEVENVVVKNLITGSVELSLSDGVNTYSWIAEIK